MNGKNNTPSKSDKIDWEKAQKVLDHWGEHLREPASISYIDKQEDRRNDDKKSIAIWIVQYLASLESETGMTIFLDTGSTVKKMTEYLLKAIAIQKLGAVSVVTASMVVLDELNDWTGLFDIRLILTGGEFDRSHQAFWGTQTVEAMNNLDYHVVVIGTSGISFKKDKGVYIHGLTNEQITKGAFLQKDTDYRIILADYSKIGAVDISTCVKPDDLLEGVRRQCLVVTTPPPQDDEFSQRRFEEEIVAFEELCKELKKKYPEELFSSTSARELKLVVVDPQSGEEIEEMSRSSRLISLFTTEEDYFKNNNETRSISGVPTVESPSDTEDIEHETVPEQ